MLHPKGLCGRDMNTKVGNDNTERANNRRKYLKASKYTLGKIENTRREIQGKLQDKVRRREDVGSDHMLVRAIIQMKLKLATAENRKVNRRKRYNFEPLEYETTKIDFNMRLKMSRSTTPQQEMSVRNGKGMFSKIMI